MLLQQPMKKQMSRKMKAPSRQGRCRPVQIVQQGVKSDKEADQTSRTCAGQEPLPERERQGEANREEEEMKKTRDTFETLHKDMVRALQIRWFCSHWARFMRARAG